jgi:hypothetical protein
MQGRPVPIHLDHGDGSCRQGAEPDHQFDVGCVKINCKDCSSPVFLIRHNGGAVLVDELGKPWPVHSCYLRSSSCQSGLPEFKTLQALAKERSCGLGVATFSKVTSRGLFLKIRMLEYDYNQLTVAVEPSAWLQYTREALKASFSRFVSFQRIHRENADGCIYEEYAVSFAKPLRLALTELKLTVPEFSKESAFLDMSGGEWEAVFGGSTVGRFASKEDAVAALKARTKQAWATAVDEVINELQKCPLATQLSFGKSLHDLSGLSLSGLTNHWAFAPGRLFVVDLVANALMNRSHVNASFRSAFACPRCDGLFAEDDLPDHAHRAHGLSVEFVDGKPLYRAVERKEHKWYR